MSSTDRQNRLLLAEDWKKIYQSFKYADFKSYDFDNLRRTMINYIRQNYPEDFNDYIESSEYLALIDLIAFLGQNISFRIDLNSRENFIELAERRESVLRLARLLSYNPHRNKSGNGLLKISSISTTENVLDSNGLGLSNRSIIWNDSVNANWFEQFIKVINTALPATNQFGKPVNSALVSGIPTEQYKFNSVSENLPIFTFSKPVNNRSLKFEIVSTILSNNSIIEEPPRIGNQLSFVYRDNNQGPGSNFTGFFLHFREGDMQRGEFTIDSPVPNQKIDVNVTDINDTDVWLYNLDSNGRERDLWTKVDAIEGNNIVYNSLNKKIRNIYSVLTRVEDRISLVFSDGIFGNLPKGRFRAYYRSSANKDYTILPSSINNISIKIPYISKSGKDETLTLVLDLKVAVDNASSSESSDNIKTNAPATYYTQNRLVTAEDYNIGPLGISQDIVKTKSVNRISSGISRYFDILDATGKYSKTNLFGTDGILYKDYQDKRTSFSFASRTDVERTINNLIIPIIQDKNVRNFYLDQFSVQSYIEQNLSWKQVTKDTNRSTGLIVDKDNTILSYQVGSFTEGILRFVESDAMIKFTPPAGKKFNKNNEIVNANSGNNLKDYIWCKIIRVVGDGSQVTNGIGSIILNDIVPTGAIIDSVKIKFVRDFTEDTKNQIIDQVFAFRTFGIRYDLQSRMWKVIIDDNLNVFENFSLSQTGSLTNQQLDSSWILLFETNGITYDVTYRTLRYVFESDTEIKFFVDSNNKVYDVKTGKIIKDTINLLNINTLTDSNIPIGNNLTWEIYREFKDIAGYVNSKKLEVIFSDSDDDGVIDNPNLFNELISVNDYIFTKKTISNNTQTDVYVSSEIERIQIVTNSTVQPLSTYVNGSILYFKDTDVFKKVNRTKGILEEVFDYTAFNGKDKLKFQYTHSTNENNRIDPSTTNIIDTYILTRQYDSQYRNYIIGNTNLKPLPPSSDSLFQSFGTEISKIKSISDEVIYHPVKYKSLFGTKSDIDMQATFKVVKNTERVVSDNDIKTRVISSINKFFALDNWDFGETFYFSELSAFIMKELSPDITSVVVVPKASNRSFGSLFEIKCEVDEIFISSATVDDVEIITSNTPDRLRTNGTIVTSSNTTNTGIQSSEGLNISTNTGGFTY
jgi:hypothetical protein